MGAHGINNLGIVVGEAEPPGGQGRRGFTWVDGQMLNLNDLLVGATRPVIIAAFLITDSNAILAIGYGPSLGTYLLKPVGAVP